MIGTYAIKMQQLRTGYFQTGTGPYKILIQGSCRVAPIVDYLDKWNAINRNQLTIFSIDPFSFNWNLKDERVDYGKALAEWETNLDMLDMLSSVDCFIHEYFQNSGMFNVKKDAEKNIYQFGFKPKIDVCIPSWNDRFVMFGEIASFDTNIRKKVCQDINVLHGLLTSDTVREVVEISHRNLDKFYEVCALSDMPEMADHVRSNIGSKRFFHTFNHTSKHYTLAIMRFLNDHWLHLDMPESYWELIGQDDMFSSHYTKLSQYDKTELGFDWPEEIVPLREILGV